ncbi:hypothetical protein QTP88_016029 [Uroleucon formosanum]
MTSPLKTGRQKKSNNVTPGTDPVQCSEAISDFFESTPIPCLVLLKTISNFKLLTPEYTNKIQFPIEQDTIEKN